MKSRENPLELMESNRVYKEKRVGSFDVKVRLLFFTDSLMSRICAKYLGGCVRSPFLRRSTPLGAFRLWGFSLVRSCRVREDVVYLQA